MKRLLAVVLAATSLLRAQEPKPAAVSAYNLYVAAVESRLAQQHRSPALFLVPTAADPRDGRLTVERLTPSSGQQLPGAMLHHWRATAFAPGAKAADLERLLRDFSGYPQRYAPQVLRAGVSSQQQDFQQAFLRVRQKHILTVVMDTAYDVSYGRLDARHSYSASRSTSIHEVDTATDQPLAPDKAHGFLWRQNTYWSYEERDGGLALQIESISLSRSIPAGLGWAVRPFVESVPRESLEFTLRSTLNALKPERTTR